LLFVHDDNKSNNGQIGQVVAMGGNGKTQDFFLWLLLGFPKWVHPIAPCPIRLSVSNKVIFFKRQFFYIFFSPFQEH
jgi:hypothetical protein